MGVAFPRSAILTEMGHDSGAGVGVGEEGVELTVEASSGVLVEEMSGLVTGGEVTRGECRWVQ